MKKNDFKKIAKSLGIAVPASLLFISNASATPVNTPQLSTIKSFDILFSKGNSNEVINRISLFGKTSENDDKFALHVNNHSNTKSNHTNQHSNTYHSDYHANSEGYSTATMCVVHTNNHTNVQGSNSHTDHTSPHTNQHTDNPNC